MKKRKQNAINELIDVAESMIILLSATSEGSCAFYSALEVVEDQFQIIYKGITGGKRKEPFFIVEEE